MIIRLVRMTFRPDEVETFLTIFDESAAHIRAFQGCTHLELWQDSANPAELTTYSLWSDETALDDYRRSDLFTTTWARTKALFAAPPRAISHRLLRPHSAPKSA